MCVCGLWRFGVVRDGRRFVVVGGEGNMFQFTSYTVSHIKLCGRPSEEENMMCVHNVNFPSFIK